jgi:hypothetical protein
MVKNATLADGINRFTTLNFLSPEVLADCHLAGCGHAADA